MRLAGVVVGIGEFFAGCRGEGPISLGDEPVDVLLAASVFIYLCRQTVANQPAAEELYSRLLGWQIEVNFAYIFLKVLQPFMRFKSYGNIDTSFKLFITPSIMNYVLSNVLKIVIFFCTANLDVIAQSDSLIVLLKNSKRSIALKKYSI